MKARLATLLLLLIPFAPAQQPTLQGATNSPGILSSDEVAKLMPATVFFQGKSAPVQLRNAAGARFTPTAILLAALVDTSGYSSAVQARYQAYLITETAVSLGGHVLPAGAYGVGFLPGDKIVQFVVMDLGGHDLFLATATADPTMRRPRPLQITPDPNKPTQFRLYEGRSFVAFTEASSY